MPCYYAMSDIHADYSALMSALELVDLSGENKLVFLGDYIHGAEQPYRVLDKIMSLEQEYGSEKVIVLAGNHEVMATYGRWAITSGRFDYYGEEQDDEKDDRYLTWMENLRHYYVADGKVIFVHAGVDEDMGELWEKYYGDESVFTEKYPPTTGKFLLPIVAGHTGTATISGDRGFHDIYFDGESHYYIDSTVQESGFLNVIKVDTDNNRFYSVSEHGEQLIVPYDWEN